MSGILRDGLQYTSVQSLCAGTGWPCSGKELTWHLFTHRGVHIRCHQPCLLVEHLAACFKVHTQEPPDNPSCGHAAGIVNTALKVSTSSSCCAS